MKVALAFPRMRYPSGDPPLGILYIASRLRQKTDAEIFILDPSFERKPWAFLEKNLLEIMPDIIGISTMVTTAREAGRLARMAKDLVPGCRVVMGGPHATVLPERVLNLDHVDAVCVGEGEDAFCDLALKGTFEDIPGFYYKSGGEIIRNPARSPIPSLDDLPFPCFNLIDMEKYFSNWFQLDTVGPGMRGTSVLATRGCPFRCSYCQPTLDKIFGKGLRKRSPKNVCDELQGLVENYGINAFLFADDTFIADRAWVAEFCAELLKRRMGLLWGCNVRADLVDEKLLSIMKDAGLRKVYMGIEAHSDRIRERVFNKKIKKEDIENAVGAAGKLGLKMQGYFMLGAPGETRKEMLDTLKWSRKLDLFDATFNLTTPLPGTYLYDKYESFVSLEPEDMDYYRRYAFKGPDGKAPSWLGILRLWAYIGFYMRPSRIIHLLRLLVGPSGMRKTFLKLKRVL